MTDVKKMKEEKKTGNNWVDGGLGDGTIVVPLLLIFCPMLAHVLAFVTSGDVTVDPKLGVSGFVSFCTSSNGPMTCLYGLIDFVRESFVKPTPEAIQFLVGFMGLALVLDVGLPGNVETGPETLTGHIPKYVDNGLLHFYIFTALFVLGSNIGIMNWYDFGIMYDTFPACITCLNIFGMCLAVFLYVKGLYFPSTKDSGTTGSLFKDFTWGTELYPRVFGVDIKRFVNCRFSMTYWMLAGLSFTYKSYKLHGDVIDYGLLLGAISQFLYLWKFFAWEIGYMRSIDIIVDRAGWEIQWGCLVWVPSVYTFHSRFCVQNPSQWSPAMAVLIFTIGMMGVVLNYWADLQRQKFREANGNILIWGKYPPIIVEAQYTVLDHTTNTTSTRTSLLLASGFWGIARHFHYVFELTAAWSWCILSNPSVNGILPLFYCIFLTILLTERAKRDEKKCQNKYGKYYDEYSKRVPYLILPGIY